MARAYTDSLWPFAAIGLYPCDIELCAETMLFELIERRLVIGMPELPELIIPFELSSSTRSADLAIGENAASMSHMKTSPPRPPEAMILL